MNFNLVDGKIKFLTHKVEWVEREENQQRNFYSVQDKDIFVLRLADREIIATITEYEQPTVELIESTETKTFNTYEDGENFLNGTLPKTEKERISDLEMLVLQLGGVI